MSREDPTPYIRHSASVHYHLYHLLTGSRVIGVDLQVLDIRQTPLVHSAISVLFEIDGFVESRVDRQFRELVFHVGRAYATSQVGQ